MDSSPKTRNFEDILNSVRRGLPWIVLCFLLVTGTSFALSKHQRKRYTATASLVFNNSQLGQQVAGLQTIGTNNPQAQQNTNLKLVQIGDMAEKTAKLLGQGLTEAEIAGELSVSAQGESNIVDVSATSSSPTLAAQIANTYSRQFVREQQNSNHRYYSSALALVNKQLAELAPAQRTSTAAIALQNRAQSLGVLAELRSGNVQIARLAKVPSGPSSPKVARNAVVGGVLGLLLGFGITLLLERLDRRIREPSDLEAVYRLPLLGVVPESSALSDSSRRGLRAQGTLPASETEAFHLIRAHLRYFNVDRELRTLLVASATPGDGKTTVAGHLATAAARMGSRVLLIEADLRRPTIAQHFAIQSGPGVSDVLIGALSFREALQSVDLEGSVSQGSQWRSLDVLVAGAALPPNPGELIESDAMGLLLEQAKSDYDLVVIDTPPLTAVSDAFPLLRKVDGVIVVGRVGHNRRDIAERLRETLAAAEAPLLGVIANGVKSGGLGSYVYDYSYIRETPSVPAPVPLVGIEQPRSG